MAEYCEAEQEIRYKEAGWEARISAGHSGSARRYTGEGKGTDGTVGRDEGQESQDEELQDVFEGAGQVFVQRNC